MITLEILVRERNGGNLYMRFKFDELEHAIEFGKYFVLTFQSINAEAAEVIHTKIELKNL